MQQSNLTKELVTRTGQMSFYKYIGVLPNPDTLFSRYGKTYQTYRDLKSDPHLWACLQSRKAGALAHKYELVAADASAEVYRFVKENLAELDMQRLLRQMLDAVFMGFQPFELVWREGAGKSGYGSGQSGYRLRSVEARPQEYFSFDSAGVLRLRLPGEFGGAGRELPPGKLLLVQHEADYDNPYGQALLGKCYWAVTFKSTALRFWVNFIEKFGLPTIVANYSSGLGAGAAEDLMESLLRMQEQNTIVASDNIRVQLHESNKQGNVELYRELIGLCNAEISKVVLSSTLTTEIGSGSFAAAKTHQEVRRDVVESDLDLLEKSVGALVRMVVELNFGAGVPAPAFRFQRQ